MHSLNVIIAPHRQPSDVPPPPPPPPMPTQTRSQTTSYRSGTSSKLTSVRRKLHERCARIVQAVSSRSPHRGRHRRASSSGAAADCSTTASTSTKRYSSLEQRHAMRTLLAGWTLTDIERLVSLYTDTAMLAELALDCDAARLQANLIGVISGANRRSYQRGYRRGCRRGY